MYEILTAVKITAKSGRPAVIINNEYSVTTSSDGRYFVSHNIANGHKSEDQELNPIFFSS